MKKTFIFLLLISFHCYSQNPIDQDYDKLTNPNSNNKLSNYFKEKVHPDLLKNITFPKSSSKITLSFNVNKENTPYNTRVHSYRNSELNNLLKKSFNKYPLENFNVKFDTKKKYYIQIITKKVTGNVIECSTNPINMTSPNLKSCEDLNFYSDINKCVNKNLRNYFYNSINYNLADSVFSEDDRIKLNIKLSIDKNGSLKLKKLKVPEIFKKHITEIVENSNLIFKPKSINGIPKDYYYHVNQFFTKGDKPTNSENDQNFDEVFKPNSTNNFAVFLKENLSNEEVNNANLNRINNRLKLFFELDITGKPFNINTNSRSEVLNKKIITLFQKYDLTKSHFINKHSANKYFTPVIVFNNGKNKIATNSIMGYSRIPIFPKCKNSLNATMAKKCYDRTIRNLYVKNFKSKIANRLNLSPGKKRIYISFKIDENGKITEIKSKAPHPKLKKEAIRVIKKLPNPSPAIFGNKASKVGYTLPITFNVE